VQRCNGTDITDEALGRVKLESPWVSVGSMDVDTLFSMPLPDRLAWYRTKLCPYRNQLLESATGNKVPPQLIATVILNELGDINAGDLLQDAFNADNSSVGPAQMQIKTALEFAHVDVPAPIHSKGQRDVARYVSRRLQIMQIAIEAAAREIKRLLELMTENKMSPWQTQHHFKPPSVVDAFGSDVRQLYYQQGQIWGRIPTERFMSLCDLVIAAYNSPNIVIATTPGVSEFIKPSNSSTTYMNGRIHGANGAWIGGEIHDAGLFR